MNEQIIQSLYQPFQPYVKQLLLGNIGLGAGIMQITDVRSGRPKSVNNSSYYGDRFKVTIPFAGHFIKWEVVFNYLDPLFAPDFSFSDDFLTDPDVDMIDDNVPSLGNWDHSNDNALLQVITELLKLYKKYQVELLNDFHRIQFEYSSLIGVASINEDEVEVLISGGASLKKIRVCGLEVNFLVGLGVDFSGLPPPPAATTGRNCGKDHALLRVTFNTADSSQRISTELFLSPSIELVLGKSYTIHVPTFSASTALMDYVPLVTNILQEKLTVVKNNYKKRQEYMKALLMAIGNSLTEYDSISFLTASFLLERLDFHFVFHVTLNDKFPKDKPTLLFQSVYHAAAGKPFEQWCNDYPYSPRWQGSEMVARTMQYVIGIVESFQTDSVESGQIK